MADEQQPGGLSPVTTEAAKQKMMIALTKFSLSTQKMQDEADSLVFNEDQESLDSIRSFIDKTKKAEKTVEDEHKVGKEPFLSAGKAWDTAKKDLLGVISDIKTPILTKYTSLCNEIDRKKREEIQKEERKKQILAGIEANILTYSQKIADCTSKKELTKVESLINLEKSESRASKYGDYHPKAIERFNEVLLPIIRDQKAKLDEKERLKNELKDTTDPEKFDELKEKLEEKENEILQNKVEVQENALTPLQNEPIEPEYVAPSIKAKRSDIIAEIVDINLVFKKNRELLNIELKVAEAKKIGNTLKSAGAFGDKDEITVDGIKYTIKKQW